jgi:hypothetical protein
LEVSRYAAFLADDGQWDAGFALPQFVPHREPALSEEEKEASNRKWNELLNIWQAFPEENRAWVIEGKVLRYQRIVDIDTDGDNMTHGVPHILVDESPPGRGSLSTGNISSPLGAIGEALPVTRQSE